MTNVGTIDSVQNVDMLSAPFRLTLTWEQAMARPESHGLRCNLFDVGEDDWFVDDPNDEDHFIECQHRSGASIYTVIRAMEIISETGQNSRIVLIDDPGIATLGPAPAFIGMDLATPNGSESAGTPRKCVMSEVLHPAIIELAKVAPMNRQLHAMILARMGQMPPQGTDTFDKIKDWIETTFDKPVALPQWPAAGRRVPRNDTALIVDVQFESTVRGTCRYSGGESGSGEFHITRDDIDEALGSADDIDELIDTLEQLISEEAYERINPEMEGDGEGYEYHHHEIMDSDGVNESFNTVRLRRDVEGYLRHTLPHEDLERLGIE